AVSREDLRIHRRLTAATTEWMNAGCEKSFLASGTRLEQFEAWVESTTLLLNHNEKDYLEGSVAARDAEYALSEAQKATEAAAARRARNFQRIIGFLAVVGSLLLIAIAILSVQASNALNQVAAAGQTLTPIPVTLTAVARNVAIGNTSIELLRLSA